MKQQMLNIQTNEGAKTVGDHTFEQIRGQPMFHWAGKRQLTATQYFPRRRRNATATS